MSSKTLSAITEALLYLIMAFVLLCMALVYVFPSVREIFEGLYGASGALVFLTLAGALALWILGELALVVKTVRVDPFTEKNASAFVRMGIAAESAGALFTAKCFTCFTPMTAVCALVMVLSGLFALVLASVFKRAVEFKRENDLTI